MKLRANFMTISTWLIVQQIGKTMWRKMWVALWPKNYIQNVLDVVN
jgi:hypothetical protein